MPRLFLFIALLILPLTAHAHYNVWQDPVTGLTLSFPDTWRRSHNQMPDDILVVKPEARSGHPVCRVRVRDDARFGIYPPQLDDSVQRVGYSKDYAEQYLAEYVRPKINVFQDGASIGRGHALYMEADYTHTYPGPNMRRKAMVMISQYAEKVYIIDCSAKVEDFDNWKSLFLTFAKTVDFQKADHELWVGNYRNFLNEKDQGYTIIDDDVVALY